MLDKKYCAISVILTYVYLSIVNFILNYFIWYNNIRFVLNKSFISNEYLVCVYIEIHSKNIYDIAIY